MKCRSKEISFKNIGSELTKREAVKIKILCCEYRWTKYVYTSKEVYIGYLDNLDKSVRRKMLDQLWPFVKLGKGLKA